MSDKGDEGGQGQGQKQGQGQGTSVGDGGGGGGGGEDQPRGAAPRRADPKKSGGAAEGVRKQRLLEVKVGAFVLTSLLVGAAVVLLLGAKNHLFEQRVTLHADFTDVQGLKEGAPVRLSGVNVGMVSRVSFSGQRENPLIRVDLEISRDALSRLGRDSAAHIGAQGLLGDKLIEISVASSGAGSLHAGDAIQTVPPADFNHLIEQAGLIFDKARRVADNAAIAMEGFSDPKTIDNLQGSLASVRRLLRAAETGPGLAHAVFYDKRQVDKLDQLIGEMDRLVAHVDSGVRKVDTILAKTDPDGAQVVNNLSRAARNVGDAAEELKRSQIVRNLEKASSDVAVMTAYMKSGQGTVGAAIMDPTVYEQLVTVLGGVARSRVLRSLVRYAISRDDDKSGGKRVIDADNAKAVKAPGKLKASR